MEILRDKTIEQCLLSSLTDYLSKTKTGTMATVRRNILQMAIFLFGKETTDRYGFVYSEKKDVAVQQKRFLIFSHLFLEVLKKNTISEKAIAIHNNLWSQHLQHLANCGNEKAAKRFIRILEDRDETVFNIKRLQHQLKSVDHKTGIEENTIKFRCRKPNVFEIIVMKLRKLY
ncbi:uncharacterized protein LOC134229465 [Saccostrea cucullata]|uniref:uncharacterized protein LOC134229465 n=1 Tax=Saccostrea cuccullata TaxID=36930 RepID=UPI002ED4E45B